MQDPDMKTTGYGMVMQLRKNDAAEAGGSSSGFEGVERLDLLKNVNVFIRDVGKSGMPGPAPALKPVPHDRPGQDRDCERTGREAGSDRQAGRTDTAAPELRLEDAGIPAQSRNSRFSSAPQRRRSLRWRSSSATSWSSAARRMTRPDQLTSDTLDLTLVPEEKPPQNGTPTPSPDQKPVSSDEGLAQNGPDVHGTVPAQERR